MMELAIYVKLPFFRSKKRISVRCHQRGGGGHCPLCFFTTRLHGPIFGKLIVYVVISNIVDSRSNQSEM